MDHIRLLIDPFPSTYFVACPPDGAAQQPVNFQNGLCVGVAALDPLILPNFIGAGGRGIDGLVMLQSRQAGGKRISHLG